ncbi:type IV secretion system protein [Dactylosporangium sp. NPDC000521]|uniref:type IV secretion system protein n=1 Tax=Dactylosporangium sp. NPDC000521 TaxID=3363975 RepID=UPI0036810B3B
MAAKTALSAWEAVCKSFADGAVAELKFFAKAFVAFPPIDLSSGGIRSVYGMSLGLAGLIAGILLLVQIGKTALTHDGSAMARGITGIFKAVLAFMVTLTVAGTSLVAADELTLWIVNRTFGSPQGLSDKLAGFISWNIANAPTLQMFLALLGICLVTVLWFELVLRNAAVAVLIATSPISATGMMSDTTKDWFTKLVSATIRLIVLKPVIALVFAVGFGLFGNTDSADLNALFTGMVVLLLAVLAWPAIGRFFTFAASHTGGPTGLAAVLGMAANAAASLPGAGGGGGGGGSGPGMSPDDFGAATEARTMASHASKAGAGEATAGSGAAASGAASGAAASAAGGAATAGLTAIPMVLSKGLDLAQRAANSLVGRSEQMAAHAGLDGAAPYAHPAGHPRYAPPPRTTSSADPEPGADEQPPSPPPPSATAAPPAPPPPASAEPAPPAAPAAPPAPAGHDEQNGSQS